MDLLIVKAVYRVECMKWWRLAGAMKKDTDHEFSGEAVRKKMAARFM